jgi:hypothetical protein
VVTATRADSKQFYSDALDIAAAKGRKNRRAREQGVYEKAL